MPRRTFHLLSVVLAALVSLSAFQPAQAQVAFVSAKSADVLLANFRHFAQLVGHADAVKKLDAFLALVGEKSLDALDRKRPLGMYVLWPDRIGKLEDLTFPFVFFVPVSDEKRFLELLPKLGGKLDKEDGDMHRLLLDGAVPVALRFANGHAYFATEPKWLHGKEKLPAPGAFLPSGEQEEPLIACLRFDQIPKGGGELIDALVAPLKTLLPLFVDEGKKKPGETEEQYKQRLHSAAAIKQMPDFLKKGATWTVAETRAVTLRLDVDPTKHQLALDLTVTPRPGGELESWGVYFEEARSRFGPLTEKAAAGLLIHFPRSKNVKDGAAVADNFDSPLRDFLKGRDHDLVMKLLEVLFSTLGVDGIDVGVVGFLGPKDETAVLIGLKVQNGRKLDQVLRDSYKDLSAEDKKEIPIDFNHDRHGTARIHRLRSPDDKEEAFYLAIRDDVVFGTWGKLGLTNLKTALDDFGKKEPAASPLLRVRAGSKWLLADQDLRKVLEKDLSAQDLEKLHAELRLQGGKEIRVHVRMSNHLLRALAGEDKPGGANK
jgi:hypothetical protein